MEKMWFILSAGEVSGPHMTEDVTRRLQTGRLQHDAMIWWKGTSDWTKISQWQNQLPAILESLAAPAEEAQWHLFYQGEQIGPVTYETLMGELRNVPQLRLARVWNAEMSDWKSPFEVPELLKNLGVSRRQHAREFITGHAEILGVDGITRTFPLARISEGGFSVTLASELHLGDRVQFKIKSPFLVAPIRAIAQVVSTGSEVGLHFESLNMEAKSIILDYIRRQRGSIASAT